MGSKGSFGREQLGPKQKLQVKAESCWRRCGPRRGLRTPCTRRSARSGREWHAQKHPVNGLELGVPGAVACGDGVVVAAADDAGTRVHEYAADRHLACIKGRNRLLKGQLHVVLRSMHFAWRCRRQTPKIARRLVHVNSRPTQRRRRAPMSSWAVLPGSSLEHKAESEDEDTRPRWQIALEDSEDAAGRESDSGGSAKDAASTMALGQRSGPSPRRSRGFLRAEAGNPRRAAVRFCCYLCGDAGHGAADCPGDVCICCLRVGHQMSECTSGRRPVVCSACGRLGHVNRECTVVPDRVDLSSIRCLACAAYGHVDCTPHEPRPKRVSCFNCGLTGHDATGCTKDGADRWARLFTSAANPNLPGPPPAAWAASGRGTARGGRSGGRGAQWNGGGDAGVMSELLGPSPGWGAAGRARSGGRASSEGGSWWGGARGSEWAGWGGRAGRGSAARGGRGVGRAAAGKGRSEPYGWKGAGRGGVQEGGIWKRSKQATSHMRWG
jgi:hypothetical protein